MGLVSKIICGTLIVGTFFVGREIYRTDLNKVYRFIDRNPNYTTQIFNYSKNKLKTTNPSFLESLDIDSLSDEQKKEIAEDYIKNKVKGTYEESRKSLQDFYNNLQHLLNGFGSN
jgi:hypothetical protein